MNFKERRVVTVGDFEYREFTHKIWGLKKIKIYLRMRVEEPVVPADG